MERMPSPSSSQKRRVPDTDYAARDCKTRQQEAALERVPPILVTLSGMVMRGRLHPQTPPPNTGDTIRDCYARQTTVVTKRKVRDTVDAAGIVTLTRLGQLKKAATPMLATLVPIVALVSLVQFGTPGSRGW